MKNDRVEAVDRALSILDTFSAGKTRLQLKDIADQTGFYKSTILRLCGSLEAYGYIRKSADGFYCPGARLLQLGNLYQQSVNLESVIRPELINLVTLSEETASFYIRDDQFRICLYRENSPQSISHNISEGERFPLEAGAAGKILMAFALDQRQGKILKAVKQRGVYFSAGERDKYTAAIAAPVFDHRQCIGALTISGLKERFTKRFVTAKEKIVVARAKQISQQLGG